MAAVIRILRSNVAHGAASMTAVETPYVIHYSNGRSHDPGKPELKETV
ncbi:hypothetical protein [Arthrobacter sp. TE12232]